MEKKMSIIKTIDLIYEYTDANNKSIVALDKVNIEVAEGEFVAIIGTNGSGKSTLAKCLNALIVPLRGKCIVDGMDTSKSENIWNIRQKVGMVFQNPDNQIVSAIVEEDVAFGPENLGIPSEEIRERVEQALTAVGMLEMRKHAPHMLSGGQKQRIAIAGMLAIRPNCLVLDEPTAMLDPKSRVEVIDTVHKLNKEKKITVVLITHFMQEALLADKVIVMSDGKVDSIGTPREIFSDVEGITKLGLEVPVAGEVAYLVNKMSQGAIVLDKDTITDEELIAQLCQLK